MNDKEVFYAIRQLGLAVQKNNGEWRINYKLGDIRRTGDGYYTNDRQDALDTAKQMVKL